MMRHASCPIRGDAMRRFRLSTLLLLIVIAALCIALVVQQHRADRREVEARREILERFGLMGKASREGGVEKRVAGQLRPVAESAAAKVGDLE